MTSALTKALFIEKMDKLSITQQSIENTSAWVSMFRTEARHIANWWEDYFVTVDQSKRLCMIYLANDVLQSSRKKGPEFVSAFYKVLPRSFKHFLSEADDREQACVNKVVATLEERRVFGSSSTSFKQLIEAAKPPIASPARGTKRICTDLSYAGGPSSGTEPGVPHALVTAAAAVNRADAAALHLVHLTSTLDSLRGSMGNSGHSPDDLLKLKVALQTCKSALEQEAQLRHAAKEELMQAARVQEQAALDATGKSLAVSGQVDVLVQGLEPAIGLKLAGAEQHDQVARDDDAVQAAPAPSPGPLLSLHDHEALMRTLAALPKDPGGNKAPAVASAAAAEYEEYDPEEV